MLTSDEEDRELRSDFGGLWTVGYFLARAGGSGRAGATRSAR
jgi:hypothetical protein